MAVHAWSAARRTPWEKLRVQIGARLIALYQWRRGKALPGVWIIEHTLMPVSLRADDVDWALFPTLEAQRELMAHEERCARHLQRRSCSC
jgi:hypothetical protein